MNHRSAAPIAVLALTISTWLPGFPVATSRGENPPCVPVSSVVAGVVHDWDGDSERDHAVLVEGENGFDLYLILATGKWEKVADIAYGGGMMSMPELSLNEAGSLVVSSANYGIGRSHWEKMLIIAYRGGEFVVAGFEHRGNDTLLEFPDIDYQVNFATGKEIRNGKETTVSPAAFSVAIGRNRQIRK